MLRFKHMKPISMQGIHKAQITLFYVLDSFEFAIPAIAANNLGFGAIFGFARVAGAA